MATTQHGQLGNDLAVPSLRWPAGAFAAGLLVHGSDHIRRGMTAAPSSIMLAGTVQIVFAAVAVIAVWQGRRGAAPMAAFVAFASVVGFTYAHLLPSWWPAYSDSYVTGPRIGVTWFSWVSVAAELGTALILGLASVKVVGQRSPTGPSRPGSDEPSATTRSESETRPGNGRAQRVRK